MARTCTVLRALFSAALFCTSMQPFDAYSQDKTPLYETVSLDGEEARFIAQRIFSCSTTTKVEESENSYVFTVSGCLDCPFTNTSNTNCMDFALKRWEIGLIFIHKTSFVAQVSSEGSKNKVVALSLFSDKHGFSRNTISGVLVFPKETVDLSKKPVFLWQMLRFGGIANVSLEDINRDGLSDISITYFLKPAFFYDIVLSKDVYLLKDMKPVALFVGTQLESTLYGSIFTGVPLMAFGSTNNIATIRFVHFEGLSLPLLVYESWSFRLALVEPSVSDWSISIVGDIGDGITTILDCPTAEITIDENGERIQEEKKPECASGFMFGEASLEARKFLIRIEELSQEVFGMLTTPLEQRNIALVPSLLFLSWQTGNLGLHGASLMLRWWSCKILASTGTLGKLAGGLLGLLAALDEFGRINFKMIDRSFGLPVTAGTELINLFAIHTYPPFGLMQDAASEIKQRFLDVMLLSEDGQPLSKLRRLLEKIFGVH